MYQEKVKQVLIKEHKNQPTLIQKETYDAIRNGASLVGLAKTGTGKTLAYAINRSFNNNFFRMFSP